MDLLIGLGKLGVALILIVVMIAIGVGSLTSENVVANFFGAAILGYYTGGIYLLLTHRDDKYDPHEFEKFITVCAVAGVITFLISQLVAFD